MKALCAVLCSLALTTAAHAASYPQKVCLKVEGMTCQTCSMTVKAAVKQLDGIEKVVVSPKTAQATVLFDGNKVTPQTITQKVNSIGGSYKATAMQCPA
ncbi:MAG: heavy-metal-associated domain-containing protein [Zetaproteobacteria bacterium]|nr:heavy-metal-associated domain-containing protein [Zetaproteobacteria bacterium]